VASTTCCSRSAGGSVTVPVFLTFDIDFVDPGFRPGNRKRRKSAARAAGDALRLVRGLRGSSFVGFDLSKCSRNTTQAEVTSLLAGTLLHEFLALIALRSPGWRAHTP